MGAFFWVAVWSMFSMVAAVLSSSATFESCKISVSEMDPTDVFGVTEGDLFFTCPLSNWSLIEEKFLLEVETFLLAVGTVSDDSTFFCSNNEIRSERPFRMD